MHKPLVSIICICYNHRPFVEAAVLSALRQTYEHVELIVVDDASTDGSGPFIEALARQHGFKALINRQNRGNCRSFNQACAYAKGDFLIDLAADDVLLPGRVQAGVEALEGRPPSTGVHFCNVEYIDASGKSLGCMYKQERTEIPTGDIYAHVLKTHFISAPTMLFRRAVVEKIGGYDESLSYEDFDFWVRSSRYFEYCFSAATLVQKRVLRDSHGGARLKKKNPHILSTALVCEKALALNRNRVEDSALAQRCRYELKWALATEHWEAAQKLLDVHQQLVDRSFYQFVGRTALFLRPPIHSLAQLYHNLKYR